MGIKELVLKNRSYRRLYQENKVSMSELEKLVGIARNTSSGANRQPLRYKLVCDEKNTVIVLLIEKECFYYVMILLIDIHTLIQKIDEYDHDLLSQLHFPNYIA